MAGTASEQTTQAPAATAEPRARWRTPAMLLLIVVAAVWANGYVIGLDDHAIHLVFLERARDASFLSGDLLADAAPYHASFFWTLQAPLVDLVGVDPTYAILHGLSWLAMFAGLAAMARALAPQLDRRHVAWLACVPAVLAPLTFGGIPTFDALLLNRTFVVGGELLAIGLAVRGRGAASLGLVGLLANFHATTALHTAAMAGAVLLLHPDRWRQLLRGGLACVVTAAPLALLIAFGHKPAAAALPYAEWRSAVELHYPFHHFIAWTSVSFATALLMPTVAILVAFVHTRQRAWLALVAVAYVLGVGNFVATELLNLRLGTVLHLYEVGRLLTYVGFAAAATVYLETRSAPPRHRLAGLVLPLVTIGYAIYSPEWNPTWDLRWTVLVIAAGAALLLPERAPARRPAQPWLASIAVALVVGVGAYAHHVRTIEIAPGIEMVQRSETACRWETVMAVEGVPRRDLCGLTMMAWARANLPPTALVVTPPYFGHPVAGFRYRAQRRVLVNFKDGGEATFSDSFAAAWRERLAALDGPTGPGPNKDLDGLWMDSMYPGIEAYHAARLFRFERLRARYGITHVVCQVGFCKHLSWPTIYADAAFTIRKVPANLAGPSHLP